MAGFVFTVVVIVCLAIAVVGPLMGAAVDGKEKHGWWGALTYPVGLAAGVLLVLSI